MKKLLAVSFFLGLMLSSSLPNAAATLISADDAFFGANSIVRDTATNLDWLKLRMTNGLSRDALTSLLPTSPAFKGWRFATLSDVTALFDDGGLPAGWYNMTDYAPSSGYSASDLKNIAVYNAAVDFVNMMGANSSSGYLSVGVGGSIAGHLIYASNLHLEGIFDSSPSSPTVGFAAIEASLLKDVTTGDVLYTRTYVPIGYGITADHGGNYFQPTRTYLVRDADYFIPEPSTFLLLGAGLAGVGLLRWRAKR